MNIHVFCFHLFALILINNTLHAYLKLLTRTHQQVLASIHGHFLFTTKSRTHMFSTHLFIFFSSAGDRE